MSDVNDVEELFELVEQMNEILSYRILMEL